MERRIFVFLVLSVLLPIFAGGATCSKDEEIESAGLDCSESSPPDDFDCDGVTNLVDNCLDAFNPSQIDVDGDGVGDLCEIVPCGDDVCDPLAGECDVFDYCTKDCTQSLCFGLSEGETCGDGICQPLAGECSNFDPCILDCPDTFLFCFTPTCGDGVCQPWEDNPNEEVSFCFFDCICQIEKAVEDECHTNVDCAAEPGTVCGPTSFPVFEEGADHTFDISQVACECTTCGNTLVDEGEDCDPSAGFDVGVQPCLDQGFDFCDGFTCGCGKFEVCENGVDDDGDGLVDCEDSDCSLGELGEFEICFDCIDNDGDELNNCDDSDCEGHPACGPPPGPICGDLVCDELGGEDCVTCPDDCGACGP